MPTVYLTDDELAFLRHEIWYDGDGVDHLDDEDQEEIGERLQEKLAKLAEAEEDKKPKLDAIWQAVRDMSRGG